MAVLVDLSRKVISAGGSSVSVDVARSAFRRRRVVGLLLLGLLLLGMLRTLDTSCPDFCEIWPSSYEFGRCFVKCCRMVANAGQMLPKVVDVGRILTNC